MNSQDERLTCFVNGFTAGGFIESPLALHRAASRYIDRARGPDSISRLPVWTCAHLWAPLVDVCRRPVRTCARWPARMCAHPTVDVYPSACADVCFRPQVCLRLSLQLCSLSCDGWEDELPASSEQSQSM